MGAETEGVAMTALKGRCGTCEHFPGNGKKCSKNTRKPNWNRYANDYGKGACDGYTEAEK